MEDNLKQDAVEEEFDLITEEIETEESDETEYGKDYVEEESTEEVVEESEEESPTEGIKDVPHKEDPSRFEYWQSKFTQEQNARKELETKFQSLAEKLETPKAPEPEPLTPPVKPNSDDPLDKIEYLEKLAEYNQAILDKTTKSFEQQQEAQRKSQEQAQFKAYMLGEYQKSGADEKLSAEAFNFFSSEDSLNPQTQIEIYTAWKNNRAPQNPKVNQMKSQKVKQNIPLPPGVSGGQSDAPKPEDFGEDLLNFTQQYRI